MVIHALASTTIVSNRRVDWTCSCGKTGYATTGYTLRDEGEQLDKLQKLAAQRVYQHGRRARTSS